MVRRARRVSSCAIAAIAITSTSLFGACTLLVSTSGLRDGASTSSGNDEGGAVLVDTGAARDADSSGSSGDSSGDAKVTYDGGVTWAGNGHAYVVVRGKVTWIEADSAARQMGGHLVTLTSNEENEFVFQLLDHDSGNIWIGAYQPQGSPEPNLGWVWVTNEPFQFTAWESGQPNNSGGNEDGACFTAASSSSVWNDTERDGTGEGYVVELE